MTLMNRLQSVSKRTWAVLAMATAVVALPAGLLAWGPERPTYTMAHPADHITFNSITDATNYGDERNFVRISKDNQTYSDDITVANGQEYYVRIYVHNNAASNLKLVAENVVAKLNVPTQMADRIQVDGYVNSSNAQPTSVWDQAVFHGANGTPFKLSYVAGSAYYKNAKGQFTLSDSIVGNGAKLGYTSMDGKIPGCFEYSGVVYLKVKAQTADFAISKTVRKAGSGSFSENVTVNPGDKVDYQLYFKNTGGLNQTTVSIKDMLPAGMTYVAGSTWVHDAKGTRQVADGIAQGGMSMGSYLANGDVYVKFTAQAAANDKLEKCGVNTLVNTMSATTAESGTKTDTATVTVTKECTTPVKVEACNLDTKKIETVDESKIDNVHYTRDLSKCAEQPKEITVCRLADKKYPVTIKESEFDSSKYSKNPEDCKETPVVKDITVCRLEDKKYPVTIKETEFDSSKYSKNPADCKEAPVETPKCEVPGKENLPADSPECKETPATPETPTTPTVPVELPHTGIADSFLNVMGLGSLVGMTAAYVASRKQS